jgi:WD40 repeat protein
LYDAETVELLHALPGEFRWKESVLLNDRTAHTKSIRSLCFSQDSSLLFSGSADCMICVWDVKSLAARRSLSLVATLEGHAGWVTSMAVRSDNKLLASGSTDGTAKIWDLSRLTTPLANIKECGCSLSLSCAMIRDASTGPKRFGALLGNLNPSPLRSDLKGQAARF